ncbi:hypothetical protein BH23BAC4_BH23BAC4_05220 [soil metagenome]
MLLRVLGLLLFLGSLTGCEADDGTARTDTDADTTAVADGDERSLHAVARLEPAARDGARGTVTFTAQEGGVEVRYDFEGLEPGSRGFHVHEFGDCGVGEDGDPAGAAGGHFDPHDARHGPRDADRQIRHKGDFGNVDVDQDGRASGRFIDDLIRLDGANNIIGKAVIVHEGEDDLQTQPTGDAGGRAACGVIEAMDRNGPPQTASR